MASQKLSWSNLPSELLSIIFQELTECQDISHCAGVCFSWQSVIKDLYRQLKPILYPFLLLSEVGGVSRFHFEYPNNQSCLLLNLETNTTHKIFLPQLKGRRFSSSSFGWLLIFDYSDATKNMYLLDPFTRSQIKLPPPVSLPPPFKNIRGLRVITSTSPLDPNCLVLASECSCSFTCDGLALCRPGDTTWRRLQVPDYVVEDEIWENLYKYRKPFSCFYVHGGLGKKMVTHYLHSCRRKGTVFYKDNFYCMGECGVIFRIKFDHPFPMVEALSIKRPASPAMLPVTCIRIHYLLELNGDLLLVKRFTSDLHNSRYWKYRTHTILVYKIDWQRQEWVEVKNIGYNVILLDRHNCTSFNGGENNHFRENCIYFIDDFRKKLSSYDVATYSMYDTGLYDMTKNCFEWPYRSSLILASPNPLNWLKVGPGGAGI